MLPCVLEKETGRNTHQKSFLAWSRNFWSAQNTGGWATVSLLRAGQTYSSGDCISVEINVGFSFMNLSPSSWTSHCSVLHLQFSAVDLEQSLFQPFPSEVVFQSYVPCEVYEVPLILRNNDKVSAWIWRFNSVLEEESGVIHPRIKFHHLYFAGWWKSSHTGLLPLILAVCRWYLTQRRFSSWHPSPWKPWIDGNEGCTVLICSHALPWECAPRPTGCLVSLGFWQGISAPHSLFSCLCVAPCQSTGDESSLLYSGISYV